MDKEIRLGRFDKWGYKNSFSKGELARELTYMNRDYDKLEHQVKKQKEVIDKATNDIQEIIDNINDKTIISLGQFVPELEIIQDELGGSNDILKEVSE